MTSAAVVAADVALALMVFFSIVRRKHIKVVFFAPNYFQVS
jgi:hypothetical protein